MAKKQKTKKKKWRHHPDVWQTRNKPGVQIEKKEKKKKNVCEGPMMIKRADWHKNNPSLGH